MSLLPPSHTTSSRSTWLVTLAAAAVAATAAVTTYLLACAARRKKEQPCRAKHIVVASVPTTNRTETPRALCAHEVTTTSRQLGVMHLVLTDCEEDPDAFRKCIEQIASGNGLERLQIWGVDPNCASHQEALRRIIEALSKNPGLRCLMMRFGAAVLFEHPAWRTKVFLLHHKLWRQLWEAVANHPNLREVDVEERPTYFASMYEREFRDACIVRALTTNHVLTDIAHTQYDHDFAMVHTQILPALEFNRFRSVIEQAHNSRVRLWMAAVALAHPSARQNATIRRYVALSFCSCYNEMEQGKLTQDVLYCESK